MTGFGSAEGAVASGRLAIEIRTVNHRYYNPQFKLPSELGGIEPQLRERLRQLLDRGHVTVSARWLEPPVVPGAGAGEGEGGEGSSAGGGPRARAPGGRGGEGAEEAAQAQGRRGPCVRGAAAGRARSPERRSGCRGVERRRAAGGAGGAGRGRDADA